MIHVKCCFHFTAGAAAEDPGRSGSGCVDDQLKLGSQRAAQDPPKDPQEQPCELGRIEEGQFTLVHAAQKNHVL